MIVVDCVQGSPEWKAERLGSVGASRIADVCAKTKSGYAASRANLMAELILERLTGASAEGFVTAAMARGTELEPVARSAYELATEQWVLEVGIVKHPEIAGTHASPDGIVGDNGLIEIKCMGAANHLDFLLTQTIPDRYVKQMLWQMRCCDRAWCDFVAYNPDFPEHMRLIIKRVRWSDEQVAAIEREVIAFLAELDGKLAALINAFPAPAEAA